MNTHKAYNKRACNHRLVDSALRDKSLIASRVLQLHTPSMRPCTRLQSKDLLKKHRLRRPLSLVFSSQILESTFLLFRAVLSKVDSGGWAVFVICVSLLLWDSRIFELKTAFFKPRKEDKTRGLSTKRGDEIAVFSQKAESLLNRHSKMSCGLAQC